MERRQNRCISEMDRIFLQKKLLPEIAREEMGFPEVFQGALILISCQPGPPQLGQQLLQNLNFQLRLFSERAFKLGLYVKKVVISLTKTVRNKKKYVKKCIMNINQCSLQQSTDKLRPYLYLREEIVISLLFKYVCMYVSLGYLLESRLSRI